jgi:glutathione synthase
MSTTRALVDEAISRGHTVLVAEPDGIVSWNERITISASQASDWLATGGFPPDGDDAATVDVAELDAVILRIQPPIDLDFVATCQLLRPWESRVVFVNSPTALLLSGEKTYLTRWPEISPPTVVTRDHVALRRFRDEHGVVVVKPLYDYQGAGVHLCSSGDPNWDVICDSLLRLYDTPLVAQAFISEVLRTGDKRVFVVDGEPVAALQRRPPAGGIRANLHAGGEYDASRLDGADRRICGVLAPALRASGLSFVGLDIIGGMATELSITSPTGIAQLRAVGDERVVSRLWDSVQQRVASARSQET